MTEVRGRAIGAAMLGCGSHETQIVLQQWNGYFRPLQMRKSSPSNSEIQEYRL